MKLPEIAPADQQLLRTGLAQMQISCNATQWAQLLAYVGQLLTWSTAYNLTAIREPAKIITHHLLDSLALLPFLEGPRILDVGSGAGLPGIPLAIMAPEHQMTLLDKKLKSVHFLRHVTHSLQLQQVAVVHSQMERYQPPHLFSTVVSRAVSACPNLAAQVVALLERGGALLAMQGKEDSDISHLLPTVLRLEAVHRVQVFALEAERHVVVCRKEP